MEFYDGKRPPEMHKELSYDERPCVKTIHDMQHRIDYLKQKVDFSKNFLLQKLKGVKD